MPYVTKAQRKALDGRDGPMDAGELNYAITKLIGDFTKRLGLRYQTLNTVVGVLDSAKAEFQRRVVAPYEDQKLAENCDVYPKEILP